MHKLLKLSKQANNMLLLVNDKDTKQATKPKIAKYKAIVDHSTESNPLHNANYKKNKLSLEQI